MTNLEAYRTINSCDENYAILMLENRGLAANDGDQNTLASAFAYYDKANDSSFSQGSTSEKIDASTRAQWIKTARTLAASVGVTLPIDGGSEIDLMEI
jgi:hypothetical protein